MSTPTPPDSASAAPASGGKPAPVKRPGAFRRFWTSISIRYKIMIGLVAGLCLVMVLVEAKKGSGGKTAANVVSQASPTAAGEPADSAVKPPVDPATPQTRFGPSFQSAQQPPKSADDPVSTPMVEDGSVIRRDTGEALVARFETTNSQIEPEDEDRGPRLAGQPNNRPRDSKRVLPEIFGMPFDERDSAMPATAVPQSAPVAAVQAAHAPATPSVDPLAKEFAPFGRLLICETVNTVDSLAPGEVPLIAVVTKSLNWNGTVIVPALTEVHGLVDTTPKIDAAGVGRLYDKGVFTLVFPRDPRGRTNGREMVVRGRVMDRREVAFGPRGEALAWDVNDLAPGLIGYTISTLDNEEIKLFAASFLGAAAKGFSEVFMDREASPGSAGENGYTQPKATVENAVSGALGAGLEDSLNRMAGRIEESIKQRGIYVRVPAAKRIYIYVEQTIDPRAAQVGLHAPKAQTAQADPMAAPNLFKQ